MSPSAKKQAIDSGWDVFTACDINLASYVHELEASTGKTTFIDIDTDAIHQMLLKLQTPTTRPTGIFIEVCDRSRLNPGETIVGDGIVGLTSLDGPAGAISCQVVIANLELENNENNTPDNESGNHRGWISSPKVGSEPSGEPGDEILIHNMILLHELRHAVDFRSDEAYDKTDRYYRYRQRMHRALSIGNAILS